MELWEVTFNWLRSNGHKVNRKFCKEEIVSHPDYPTLLSVVDFLDNGGMRYRAVEADISFVNEFNYPVLAHMNNMGDSSMRIIEDATMWDVTSEATKYWTGVVVYSEKNARWHNKENTLYRNREKKSNASFILFIAFGLFLYGISIYKYQDFLWNSFGIFSLVGLAVSVLVMGSELGIQNQIVKQFCSSVNSLGCDSVLRSSYANGILVVTPSDASLLYFSAQFIFYVLASWYPYLLGTISSVAFVGLLIGLMSIYLQSAVLKQWCALCLGIVGVLLFQGAISFSRLPITFSFLTLLGFVCLYLIFLAILFPIKELLKANIKNSLKVAELKRWKWDISLLIGQLEKERLVDITTWADDFVLGNPDAKLLITFACNPYCPPCAQAHEIFDSLLLQFPDKLKLQIRFFCDINDEKDRKTIAVRAMLERAAFIEDKEELQEMLTDWFKWMDYEKWISKWKTPDHEAGMAKYEVYEQLVRHSQWAVQNRIEFTPIYFLNGKKIPARYWLEDIQNLVPQLLEVSDR